jgi:3D (Asp-Asp-Asp) domain-containing protein
MRSAILILALLPQQGIIPSEQRVPSHTMTYEQPAPRHTKPLVPQHTEQPVPRHIEEPEANWWYVRATVTAYSPHDKIDSGHASTKDTKTSTMVDWRTSPYGIAADPRAIPYNTHIYVPGYVEKLHPYTSHPVDDTGGRMRGAWRKGVLHIDLRYKTEYSASLWGKKQMDVLVDVSNMTTTQKAKLRPYKTGEL